jgi:hypothetical protein
LPREVEMLVAMDAAYLSACAKERDEAKPKSDDPKKKAPVITGYDLGYRPTRL